MNKTLKVEDIEKPLKIVLEFVERWNKNDKALDVAHAAEDLKIILDQAR